MWWRFSTKVRKSFFKHAGPYELLDYTSWKKALTVNSDFLAKRLFTLIDEDGSGYIDLKEYRHFISQLKTHDNDKKIQFLFSCYDADNDGKLSRTELHQLLSTSLSEQALSLPDDTMSELTQSVLDNANVRKAHLNFEDFKVMFQNYPELEQQVDRFVNELLGVAGRDQKFTTVSGSLWLATLARIKTEAIANIWLLGYVIANTWLFSNAMERYAEQGASLAVQIARGGGACLNFNGALILLPMCKALLSTLRHSFFHKFLPLNHLNAIHKNIGFALIGFSAVHIGAHYTNYFLTGVDPVYETFFTVIGLTGVGMSVALLYMAFSAVTRSKNYERFYLSHLLYAPFLAALLFHGSMFYLWFMPSALLYSLDALARYVIKKRRVEVTELKPLSDRVTQVKFKRGRHFSFSPGDYIKINMPEVSKLQWHPFTLSAAPESDRIDIHVRTAGNWTAALHNLANKPQKKRPKWVAYVDGPYAAPTSSIYRSSVAILIAGGIGVTPFASVIQSILKAEKDHPQTIYFHWLNRSQQSYSWFIELIRKAETNLGEDKFHAFIHLTRLAQNLSNLLLQVAFDSYWKVHQVDPLTGLRAKTQAGRPDWLTYFKEVKNQHPDTPVDVFFCGPKQLGKQLQKDANRMGFLFYEEQFD